MKTLVIEEGRKIIEDKEFYNSDYEEIIIPDSVISIGNEAFQKCQKLKKIKLSKNLKIVGFAAFDNCTALEDIEIPESLTYLSKLCFIGCTNLKSLKLHNKFNYIDDYALFNCKNLTDFEIPNKLSSLGILSLARCNKIKSVRIPTTLDNIEFGALSQMASLENIYVDNGNPKYNTFDNVSLIDTKNSSFIQYAIAANKKEYTVYDYPIFFGELKSRERIYHIADYAFAGAKNLTKLNLTAAVESMGSNTFANIDCEHLCVLIDSYSQNIIFNIFYSQDEYYFPFKTIEFEEGVESLSSNMSEIFKNAEKVILPKSLKQIGTNVFLKSEHLKDLYISENTKMISPNTFHEGITLHFENFMDIKSEDFITLQTKASDESYLSYFDKDNTRIYSLKDGTYYVKFDDFDYIRITKEEIEKYSEHSNLLSDEPDLFLKHFFKLTYLYANYVQEFYNTIRNKEIYNIFDNFLKDLDSIYDLTNNKLKELIKKILNNNNHYDEFLLDGLLMRRISKEDLLLIMENINPSLERILKKTDYLKIYSTRSFINHKYYDLRYIIEYSQLLEKYQIKDRLLFNENIALNVTKENQVLLVKSFNKNIKRLLLKSNTIDNISLNDLLNFMHIMGVFTNDLIFSQKVTTFIIEKVISTGDDTISPTLNNHIIANDNIHRVFNELKPKDNIDYEWIEFFIKNYEKLTDLEIKHSGIIARIYNNFEDITKYSTSDHGNQRRKKVTIEKCLNYFLYKTFSNINDNNKDLAVFLAPFFNEDGILTKAEEIIEEAKKAKRNIFTDSMNPDADLKKTLENGYTYEWLNKQSWDNLVLGKYCNCCAHIHGNGAGIMLASMVDNNVQNLVIKNNDNIIIAKATIYINREKGYGVFNTIELNGIEVLLPTKEYIYEAFIQGTKDFITAYNQNNKIPITEISIGTNQNELLKTLKEHDKQERTDLLIPLDYSDYAYEINNQKYGKYKGDAREKQLTLYKTDI